MFGSGSSKKTKTTRISAAGELKIGEVFTLPIVPHVEKVVSMVRCAVCGVLLLLQLVYEKHLSGPAPSVKASLFCCL